MPFSCLVSHSSRELPKAKGHSVFEMLQQQEWLLQQAETLDREEAMPPIDRANLEVVVPVCNAASWMRCQFSVYGGGRISRR